VVEYFAKAALLPLAELPAYREPCADGSTSCSSAFSPHGFEIDCLESILATTARRLRRRAQCFAPTVDRLLLSMVSKEPEAALVQLVSVSRALVELEQICNGIIQCLEDVLQCEEEMLSLLLTARRTLSPGEVLPNHHHEVVETLLESYLFVFKSISDQLFLSNSAIEKTQQSARITLEHKRTHLLALNVQLSIATLSLGVVAAVGGLLGMNVPLPPTLAEHAAAFPCVTVGAIGTATVIHGITAAFAMRRPESAKLRQVHRAQQLAGNMPELADLLLKRLESYSMISHTSEPALSFEEFCELVRSDTSRGNVDVHELREMFDVFDHNNDGRLQMDDIAEFLCVIAPSALDGGPGK